MVSDASKKKAAQKKAAAAAKRGGKSVAAATSSKAAAASNGVEKVSDGIGSLQISDRTCTGVLCSHPLSRDIHLNELLYTLSFVRRHKQKPDEDIMPLRGRFDRVYSRKRRTTVLWL